ADLEALAAADSKNRSLRFEAIGTRMELARTYGMAEKWKEGLQGYTVAHESLIQFCNEYPRSTEYLYELAHCENGMAACLMRSKLPKNDLEASKLLKSARTRLEEAKISGLAKPMLSQINRTLDEIKGNEKILREERGVFDE